MFQFEVLSDVSCLECWISVLKPSSASHREREGEGEEEVAEKGERERERGESSQFVLGNI